MTRIFIDTDDAENYEDIVMDIIEDFGVKASIV